MAAKQAAMMGVKKGVKKGEEVVKEEVSEKSANSASQGGGILKQPIRHVTTAPIPSAQRDPIRHVTAAPIPSAQRDPILLAQRWWLVAVLPAADPTMVDPTMADPTVLHAGSGLLWPPRLICLCMLRWWRSLI
jgi:hypothetical protein